MGWCSRAIASNLACEASRLIEHDDFLIRLDFIPASLVIPERRWETLFQQAILHQQSQCLYPAPLESNIQASLFSDFRSDKSDFPRVTLHVFEDHEDEVWYVSFSHNGHFLATASRDSTCIIYDAQVCLLSN